MNMTIEIIKGDLLKAFANDEINSMVHCCNMQHVMGAGIAKKIKSKYQQAYTADAVWYYAEDPEYSHMSLACIEANKYIVNIYGQRYYGVNYKHLNEEFLRTGLMQLAKFSWSNGDQIGIPYAMGCGLAGGDWKVVLKIIKEVFINPKVNIYRL
jgi:O-acetyl-ADP-ribose deacetylase (regulator of RNase III)